MALYFFDFRDHSGFVADEEVTELRDVRAVQNEAARALSGLAWDAMRLNDVIGQQMVIEVRDAQGPVMEAKLSFEIARKARSLG